MNTQPEFIDHRALSSLHRWDKNYRVGDVDAIIASIVRFGFNSALRVWEDGRVMAGNHALIALETMHASGAKPPRGIRPGTKGDWIVPIVNVSHLSRLEAEAYAIADNRTQELGRSDPGRLAELLKSLAKQPDGLQGTGYVEADLADLLAALDPPAFVPAGEEQQQRLDVKDPLKCPQCGHEFVPPKR